jgi:RNA polymerase sigma factor (sigma-70 family)
MTGAGADDGEERFRHLYTSNRDRCITYAGRKIRGETGTNKQILGVEAEEIYDEAMARYYRATEHLQDHDDNEHERNIKRRINQCVITWLRKKGAAGRIPPGLTASLDAPRDPDDDDAARPDPSDPRAHDAEELVDLTDRLDRLDPKERSAAGARARGDTFKEIGEDAGVSEETARSRVRRAVESLKDDP